MPLYVITEALQIFGKKRTAAAFVVRRRFDVDELARQCNRIDRHGFSIPERRGNAIAAPHYNKYACGVMAREERTMQSIRNPDTLTPEQLAGKLDHTLLKPEATQAQVENLCDEAATYHFACAMVNPCWVPLAVQRLRGSSVPVGVVIGFPLGASLSDSKLEDATRVIHLGAHDVDMVLNIGWLKSGMHTQIRDEITAIATRVHEGGGILKVILETALLTEDEKRRASELSVDAGADFIKTSTGFASGGATVADIRLMRGIAGERCGVKASGGIRTLADAQAMLAVGADRIGASACVAIVNELRGGAAASAAGY